MIKTSLFSILLAGLLASCSNAKPATSDATPAIAGESNPAPSAVASKSQFNADSAYAYVARQLDFGPRVPGSAAQEQCAAWIRSELTRFGAEVSEQRTEAVTYDGQTLPVINLMGSYNTESSNRILILAHWDSRPMADEDPDPSKRKEAVPAANDGASGVGVMLELARQASIRQPKFGVDLLFVDLEDFGAPDDWAGPHKEEYWALGTQKWCEMAIQQQYRANYGILLDMVGAHGATFYREYYSDRFASDVTDKVWRKARELGYGNMFIDDNGAGITDDHVFVNRMTGIPTIDIIDTREGGSSAFYPYWHTTDDTLDKISQQTLRAVGDVLMHIIY